MTFSHPPAPLLFLRTAATLSHSMSCSKLLDLSLRSLLLSHRGGWSCHDLGFLKDQASLHDQPSFHDQSSFHDHSSFHCHDCQPSSHCQPWSHSVGCQSLSSHHSSLLLCRWAFWFTSSLFLPGSSPEGAAAMAISKLHLLNLSQQQQPDQ